MLFGWRPAVGALIAAVAVVCIVLGVISSCRCRDASLAMSLKAWRLPADLAEKQTQLSELTLPPAVDRADWISDRVTTLNAAGTQIADLRGLPRTLKQLDIRDAARLNSLAGLPPHLEVLKASGKSLDEISTLPPSLIAVELQDSSIENLQDFPETVRSILLSGSGVEYLPRLPRNLQSLILKNTKIRSLKGLPDNLRTLVLVSNSDLHFEEGDIPLRLTYLVVDDQKDAPNWIGVRYLCALSDRREQPEGPWPDSLSSLTLRATNLHRLPSIPSSVRVLGLLDGSGGDLLSALPPELEELDLTGFRVPESVTLPGTLRAIELGGSTVNRLPALPSSLEKLDLSNTSVTDLKMLPKTLKTLLFRGATQARLMEVETLPVLEQLDLAGSSVGEIKSLSPTLIWLSVRGTRVRDLPVATLSNLMDLDISGTPIGCEILGQLPRKLRSLTISAGQLSSLENLPKSVQALHFIP
jgi:hypothetical protein